jgi:hypothetical protein
VARRAIGHEQLFAFTCPRQIHAVKGVAGNKLAGEAKQLAKA